MENPTKSTSSPLLPTATVINLVKIGTPNKKTKPVVDLTLDDIKEVRWKLENAKLLGDNIPIPVELLKHPDPSRIVRAVNQHFVDLLKPKIKSRPFAAVSNVVVNIIANEMGNTCLLLSNYIDDIAIWPNKPRFG